MMDSLVRSLNQRELKFATSGEDGVANLQSAPGRKAPSQTWLLRKREWSSGVYSAPPTFPPTLINR